MSALLRGATPGSGLIRTGDTMPIRKEQIEIVPPLILAAGIDTGCYSEARLGIGGRWLTACGEPVPLDAQVLINEYVSGVCGAVGLRSALESLGYTQVRCVRAVQRRGTASYGYRGAYREVVQ